MITRIGVTRIGCHLKKQETYSKYTAKEAEFLCVLGVYIVESLFMTKMLLLYYILKNNFIFSDKDLGRTSLYMNGRGGG